jgi:beta-barrel assembly-enhancing protease
MRTAVFALVAALSAAPAYAQFGDVLNKIQKAKDKVDELNIDDREERQLGETVSANLREKYGVVQSEELTKYVTLVGTALAQASTRPNLNWRFIVLDTDGVNAFAAPGGIVHVTRGLLGLVRNEAELAGALGHEITHITVKHTVRAIEKSKTIQMASDEAGSGTARDRFVAALAQEAYNRILNNEFSREDESEADRVGVQLASRLGYAPHGLVDVLRKLDARNSGRDERNGLFASHPATKERIDRLEKQIKDEKLTGNAIIEARYTEHVHFEAKPLGDIAVGADGAAGLAGGSNATKDSKDTQESKDSQQQAEGKKKGSLLSKFTTSSSGEKQSTQTIASAGARGIGPDRDAKGGPNKNIVVVTVTATELAAFKKGITA